MQRFAGHQVIVHRAEIVQRTWKERLFSIPWRPWQRTRLTTPPLFGLDDRYIIMSGVIHCTEKGYDALRQATNPAPMSTGYPKVSNGNGWFCGND